LNGITILSLVGAMLISVSLGAQAASEGDAAGDAPRQIAEPAVAAEGGQLASSPKGAEPITAPAADQSAPAYQIAEPTSVPAAVRPAPAQQAAGPQPAEAPYMFLSNDRLDQLGDLVTQMRGTNDLRERWDMMVAEMRNMGLDLTGPGAMPPGPPGMIPMGYGMGPCCRGMGPRWAGPAEVMRPSGGKGSEPPVEPQAMPPQAAMPDMVQGPGWQPGRGMGRRWRGYGPGPGMGPRGGMMRPGHRDEMTTRLDQIESQLARVQEALDRMAGAPQDQGPRKE
jgi:hypothetical protein